MLVALMNTFKGPVMSMSELPVGRHITAKDTKTSGVDTKTSESRKLYDQVHGKQVSYIRSYDRAQEVNEAQQYHTQEVKKQSSRNSGFKRHQMEKGKSQPTRGGNGPPVNAIQHLNQLRSDAKRQINNLTHRFNHMDFDANKGVKSVNKKMSNMKGFNEVKSNFGKIKLPKMSGLDKKFSYNKKLKNMKWKI